jgi:hypothetical protein
MQDAVFRHVCTIGHFRISSKQIRRNVPTCHDQASDRLTPSSLDRARPRLRRRGDARPARALILPGFPEQQSRGRT